MIIYQLLLRAFGNRNCVPGGSQEKNGTGKSNENDQEKRQRRKKKPESTTGNNQVNTQENPKHSRATTDNDPSPDKREAS
uniref:Uncharacterized protein n=1 Tax=uncultured bacterium G1 TaxID=1821258 RepID=A0A173DXL6_9BACT|nr:hypothetical protein [uncultured bacterium G1]